MNLLTLSIYLTNYTKNIFKTPKNRFKKIQDFVRNVFGVCGMLLFLSLIYQNFTINRGKACAN